MRWDQNIHAKEMKVIYYLTIALFDTNLFSWYKIEYKVVAFCQIIQILFCLIFAKLSLNSAQLRLRLAFFPAYPATHLAPVAVVSK